MLNAVESIGRLPEYYFQAIGSGAGAIAAYEAAKRLVSDSRFGSSLPAADAQPKLPFTPIYDSWKRGRREFVEVDSGVARNLTERILATVLSNQRPPYSIAGGMFDVLCESQGEMFAVRNHEVLQALSLFEGCEGIDIETAARSRARVPDQSRQLWPDRPRSSRAPPHYRWRGPQKSPGETNVSCPSRSANLI